MSKRKRRKGGYICPRYKNGKTAYYSRAVAEYDRRILEAQYPELTFEVFRCGGCRSWHVGKPKEEAAS